MQLLLPRVSALHEPVVLRYRMGRPVLQGCCCCCCCCTQHGGLITTKGAAGMQGWQLAGPFCLRSLGCEGLGLGSDLVLLHTCSLAHEIIHPRHLFSFAAA